MGLIRVEQVLDKETLLIWRQNIFFEFTLAVIFQVENYIRVMALAIIGFVAIIIFIAAVYIVRQRRRNTFLRRRSECRNEVHSPIHEQLDSDCGNLTFRIFGENFLQKFI